MSTKALGAQDLVVFRSRLHALAEQLSERVAAVAEEAQHPIGADATVGPALAPESSAASSEGDEEVARGVLASEGELLEEVRAASARIDAGTFGLCERCGRPVGLARLTAVPYARHCIRCARADGAAAG